MRTEFENRYLAMLNNSPYIQAVKRPGQEIVNLEDYTYNVTVGSAATPLVLNTDIQQTIQTHADSDFVFTYLSACVNISANADMKFNRNLSLQIQDLSTGKFFFNQSTIMTLVAGAGGSPYIYPSPRVIAPNTGLQFTVRNRDIAQNYNQFFAALRGTRIFYR